MLINHIRPTLRITILQSLTINIIKLPKLGKIKYARTREIEGRIISATVRKNPSGKYFIAINTECEINELSKTNSEIGIDLGLADFAILSDGTKIPNMHFSKQLEQKLKREKRKLSHRQLIAKKRVWKDPNKTWDQCMNYRKQKIKVAKLYERINHCKNDGSSLKSVK
ncbi:transposase [Sporolactobacillus sp. THM19-2]|nr:transposase [Sporolactobacillus sp. THM19-2]